MIKVPGSRTHKPTEGPAAQASRKGLANILVVCPYCDTRMYATEDQVGQSLVCPDCLESVVVQMPEATRQESQGAEGPSSTPAAGPPAAAGAEDDVDELTLSDPIDVPTDTLLPKTLSDLVGTMKPPVTGGPKEDQPGTPATGGRPQTPQPFAVHCPICDGRIYATDDEIGTTKNCPDCFSPVEVQRPKPKPRRVSEVVEADYEGDSMVLSEPVDLSVYRKSAEETVAKSVGEQALKDAWQRQRERETANPDLPHHPFWTGLFKFLWDSRAIIRLLAVAGLVALQVKLTILTIGLVQAGGAMLFAALLTTVGALAEAVAGGCFVGVTCLALFQATADGHDQVADWPEFGFVDWIIECLVLLMAVFFAAAPGIVLTWVLSCAGAPLIASTILTLLCIYAFFPIVFLSLLEGDSLTTPLTRPILESLRQLPLLWITFYLITAAGAVLLGLVVMGMSASMPIILALSVVCAVLILMYFRLLGRLAWAAQVRTLDRSTKPDERLPD